MLSKQNEWMCTREMDYRQEGIYGSACYCVCPSMHEVGEFCTVANYSKVIFWNQSQKIYVSPVKSNILLITVMFLLSMSSKDHADFSYDSLMCI